MPRIRSTEQEERRSKRDVMRKTARMAKLYPLPRSGPNGTQPSQQVLRPTLLVSSLHFLPDPLPLLSDRHGQKGGCIVYIRVRFHCRLLGKREGYAVDGMLDEFLTFEEESSTQKSVKLSVYKETQGGVRGIECLPPAI
jgi:hypothetical protein